MIKLFGLITGKTITLKFRAKKTVLTRIISQYVLCTEIYIISDRGALIEATVSSTKHSFKCLQSTIVVSSYHFLTIGSLHLICLLWQCLQLCSVLNCGSLQWDDIIDYLVSSIDMNNFGGVFAIIGSLHNYYHITLY